MNILLSIFAADILPIFLIAAVGFLLARFLDTSVKTLSRVVFNALVPCLTFNLLVTSKMTGSDFGRMALFCVLLMLAIGLLGRLVALPLHLDRPALIGFLLVVIFSNSGNYGMPVVLFAFGREALSHSVAYFVASSVLSNTFGVFLAATGRRSLRQALRGITNVPAIYGVSDAAVVLASGLTLPLAVTRPIELLSNAALPMMMLALGMQLERASLPERPLVVLVAVVLSLLVAPIVALGLVQVLGLAGAARQAAVIQASMPAAVVTTILALEFDVAPAFVTSVVFATTIVSPFTLTALIAYLQR